MNDTDGQRVTDWKAIFSAAGFFYVSLTGLGWIYGEYLLGRVDQRIAAHAESAAGKRGEYFGKIESAANGVVGRVGQLEQNCAVVQSRLTSAETRLDGLDHWRTECGKKMASVERFIDGDVDDIKKLEARLDRVEGLMSKGRRE